MVSRLKSLNRENLLQTDRNISRLSGAFSPGFSSSQCDAEINQHLADESRKASLQKEI